MRGRALKKYDDPKVWHNQFYELVTIDINENAFKPLFKEGNTGRSNASISQFVVIMIMKEGNRRSDEQMLERVDFDLLVRKVLELVDIFDRITSFDTYYLLRRSISKYKEEISINMIERCFKDVTRTQAVKSTLRVIPSEWT